MSKASYKFETPQQVSKETAFQNGLFKQSPESSSERRLGNFNRSERCLLTHTPSCSSQKVSSFLHSRESVPIHMSLFWSLPGAKKFHKDSDGHSSLPQNAEPEISCLSGRLVPSKPYQTVTYQRQNKNTQSPLRTRFLDQSGEIGSSTQSEHNLHRSIFPFRKGLSVSNLERIVKIFQAIQILKREPTAQNFLHLLGLMASCIEIVPHARLFMRSVQLHLLHYWRQIHGISRPKFQSTVFL